VVVGYGNDIYEGDGGGNGEIEIEDGQIFGRAANWLRAFFVFRFSCLGFCNRYFAKIIFCCH
jgi:hypothetical protein